MPASRAPRHGTTKLDHQTSRSPQTPQQADDTARRLLDAAVELFAARSFEGVSIRDIAERAGVNKGLIFYHFESKAGLLQKALDEYYQAYSRALSSALERRGTLVERFHHLLDANLDFIEENLAYVRMVQLEIALGTDNMPRIRQGLAVLHDAVATLLGGVSSAVGPLSARHFFVSFSGMVNTYFLHADALEALWDSPPLGIAQRRERREHLHWMLDTIAHRLEQVA